MTRRILPFLAGFLLGSLVQAAYSAREQMRGVGDTGGARGVGA